MSVSRQHHAPTVPRGALLGAALLLGFSLLLAAYARLTGVGVTTIEGETVAVSHAVRFVDKTDGSVAVLRGESDSTVIVLPPRSNGFVRGVMRGMARERRMHNIGPDVPFRLNMTDAGDLRLHDPGTGRTVDLQAFGPDNYEAFARIYAAADAG